MRYKKLLALFMVVIMMLSVVACGNDKPDEGATTNNVQTDEASENEGGEDSPTVIFHINGFAAPTDEGIVAVEQAMNQYCDENELGVHYDIDYKDVSDYSTQIDMMLASGERVDIFLPSNFATAVARNQVLPLDDYLDDELKGAVEALDEGDLLPSTVKGSVYAVPNQKGKVLIPYLICNADIIEELGYDVSQIETVYDLEPLFAAVQEVYPDVTPLVNTVENALITKDTFMIQNLGNGVCIEGDSTRVTNYYESEMYTELLRIMYDWNQKGYILKDLSTSTEFYRDLLTSGKGFSAIISYGNNAESVEEMHDVYGMNSLAIPLGEWYLTSAGVQWCLGYTCENPSAAAKALSYLYTEPFLMNTLIYGLEDTSWVWVDEETDTIGYPEGLGMTTVPYNMFILCGALGNQFILNPFVGNTTAEDINFMKTNNANAVRVPNFGFSMDSVNVTTQCTAVSNVIQQYNASLTAGEINPDEYLPEFLQALEDAGINDIISEVQTQLDEWRAQ